ncbi:MAG: type I phosphomannose isomerase catalytic subunit [Anaerolineae bacterium]
MSDRELYPLLFEPQLRHYVWGGRNLASLYGRRLPPGPTAESWEISGHPGAPTRAINGVLAGRTLPDLVRSLGSRLMGTRAMQSPDVKFPLLVKLLDAHRDLSVQVHPDDGYAQRHERGERGKVEAWYVLAAEANARLVYGLQPGTDRKTMAAALASGDVLDLITYLPVKAGDCVFVPAGTVHAVMAGTVVAEVQQTSDATYRLYDWGRLGNDGKPRELHAAQALDTIRFGAQGPGVVQPVLLGAEGRVRRYGLVECPQFTLEKVDLDAGASFSGLCNGETFEIWGCMEGTVRLGYDECPELNQVQFVLFPADLGPYRIHARSQATLLRAYLGPTA